MGYDVAKIKKEIAEKGLEQYELVVWQDIFRHRKKLR